MTKTSRRAEHPTLLVIVLCLGGLLASYMQTLVVPIVGKLGMLLGTRDDNATWVVTATLLAAAVAMPIAGRVADMFGKRRMILTSLSLMVAGSVVCALSHSLIPMVVGRALQGLSMSVIPVGISLLRDKLPPHRIPNAIATMSATLGVGGAIGMPIAAWIPQQFDWHFLFVTSAIAAAVVLILVVVVVEESPIRSPGKFDGVGAVGISMALICLLLPVSKGQSWGWTSPATLGLAVAGLALLAVVIAYELRHPSPLIDIRTSRRPTVALTNLVSVLIGFALMAMSLSAPQLLQIPHIPGVLDFGLGQSLVQAGLWLAPGGIMMMLLSPVSARLNVTIGSRLTLLTGALVILCGYLFALFVNGEPWLVSASVMISSSGVGIAYSAMPALIMSAVPVAETAAANGLNSLMRSIGTATSSAVMASLLTTSTVTLAGHRIPTESAFRLVFVLGAVVALAAAALTLTIPRATAATTEH